MVKNLLQLIDNIYLNSMKFNKIIPSSWKLALESELNKDYIKDLESFVNQEYKDEIIFPPKNLLFNAFEFCSIEATKVVILGQDPYHNHDQAMGLSFSVPKSQSKLPPSLKNIFKELKQDLNIDANCGDLSPWAKQGVLLLNSVLSVKAHTPASHKNKGWEQFTDFIIKTINDQKKDVVFILWGNYAKEKAKLISSKHYIISSPHPSPFSARHGFFNSKQ